jgi:triphosphatase
MFLHPSREVCRSALNRHRRGRAWLGAQCGFAAYNLGIKVAAAHALLGSSYFWRLENSREPSYVCHNGLAHRTRLRLTEKTMRCLGDWLVHELELKVELSKPDVDRLAGDFAAGDLSIGAAATTELRTVYFDTPAHDLHAAGVSLRLRRQEGGWQQTVKVDQHVEEGISNPIELQAIVADERPDIRKISDKKVRRAVQKVLCDTTLRPVFETVVQRTTRSIKVQDSEIELAIDDGEVRAGEERQDLREAELELKAGSAEGLLLAAEKLLAGHELKLSSRSKAERGYRLVLGKKDGSIEPEKARSARISRKDTCRKALSSMLDSAVRQVLVNRRAVLETDDPEAAHQLRIGIRRLRSALRALRPLVDRASSRAFERSARDMGRAVGILRDADVLILGVLAPVEAVASDKTGFAELHEALLRNREAKRDEVRRVLSGPNWAKLQLYLTLWPRVLNEIGGLNKPITKHARKALAKAWKKPAKLARHLDRLDAAQRHEMRKALKKLRYLAEFMAPLFNQGEGKRFIRQLKALQDVFGYINDARMTARLIEIQQQRQVGSGAARAASYAAGHHDAEAAHVWRRASKAWRKLERSPRFWA